LESIFTPFSKDAPELAEAKFFKIYLLGPTTATQDRKVLARFTNGAAALVEASIGAGRTILFTSTLDRDWNDLPIHGGYLPLMQQAMLSGDNVSYESEYEWLAENDCAPGALSHFFGRLLVSFAPLLKMHRTFLQVRRKFDYFFRYRAAN